jgi:hypothetical protein
MASPSLTHSRFPYAGNTAIRPVHILILLAASVGAVFWGGFLITGHAATSLQEYLFVLGLWGVASAAFIFTRIQADPLTLFGLPVFLTLLMFVRFGLVPLNSFLNPDALSVQFRGQYNFLVQALALVALGTVAFWLGVMCMGHRKTLRPASTPVHTSAGKPAASGASFELAPFAVPGGAGTIAAQDSVLAIAMVLYGVVFATRIYLLHAHLLDYAGSWKAYYANLASLQVLDVISKLGLCVLIVLAIERYQHPADAKRRIVFLVVFLSECAWGFMGGNKRPLIQDLFMVALVSSAVRHRTRKVWLLAPFLFLVLFYPLSISYRTALRHNGGIANVADASQLGQEALSETTQKQSGVNGWIESGWSNAVNRLDLLQSVGLVLSLGPSAKVLQGRERLWMLPYFPFVPRFAWSTKPILDAGARFSVLLGYGDRTSTAVTYPGDLYAVYGWAGVLVGMFLLGLVSQSLTASLTGPLDKRRLLLYASMFLSATNMEVDAFSFWTSLFRSLVIFAAVGLLIYGPRLHSGKSGIVRRKPLPQRCES